MPRLTRNFTLEEFTASDMATRHGIPNAPVGQHHLNIIRLAKVMQRVRDILGDFAVNITSGYRSPEVNKLVGGVPDSAHALGLAADFVVPGYGPPKKVAQDILPHMKDLGIDQLIYEDKGGSQWVHLGLRPEGTQPRLMAFTQTNAGDIPGIA